MTWKNGGAWRSVALKAAVVVLVFLLGVFVGSRPSADDDGGFGSRAIGDAGTGGGDGPDGDRERVSLHGPPPGEPVDAPGITLTVDEVTRDPVRVVEKYRFESGVEGPVIYPEEVTARPGGTFVTVRTTMDNTGSRAWDLVCGHEVRVQLVDDLNRRHERVERLHDIPGNPECDDNLNPGFSTTMTWIFEVPEDVVPAKLAFGDTEHPPGQYWFARLM